MTRLLATDFDDREVRYVLANTRSKRIRILAAGSIDLSADADDGEDPPASDPGQRLAEVLAQRKQRPASALIGVDRAAVELLHLTLPPATDAELPELVAHQVAREAQAASDESAIDFVPTTSNPAEPRKVIAAVLPADAMRRINAFCEGAGVKPRRMVLRSFAAASLFLRTAVPDEEICLLVNPVGSEVDLTVLVDRRAVFSRTARLPQAQDGCPAAEPLLAEIRRTLAVAMQSELGTDRVECVYVFGSSEEHQDLLEQIQETLEMPANVFDPFAAVGVFHGAVPEHSGRFASLLGMLLDEANGGAHTVDFLHPRQKPKQIERRHVIIAAVTVLVATVIGLGAFQWNRLAKLDAKNRRGYAILKELEGRVQEAKKREKLIQAVLEWQEGEVVWLDRLGDLSKEYPPRQDAVVLNMSMTGVPARNGGTIAIQGLARDPSFIFQQMEGRLRNLGWSVSSKRVQGGTRQQEYATRFDTSAFIPNRSRKEILRGLLQPSNGNSTTVAEAPLPAEDTPAGKSSAFEPSGSPKDQPPKPTSPTESP